MDSKDKELIIEGVFSSLTSITQSLIDYNNQPPKPLAPQVQTYLDELCKHPLEELLIKKIDNFLDSFRESIDPGLVKLLELRKQEVQDLLEAERKKASEARRRERHERLRKKTRKKTRRVFTGDDKGNNKIEWK